MNYELRYAAHPSDAKQYDTTRLRKEFLIETIFTPDDTNMVYSMYDRYIVGGIMPVSKSLKLETVVVGIDIVLVASLANIENSLVLAVEEEDGRTPCLPVDIDILGHDALYHCIAHI